MFSFKTPYSTHQQIPYTYDNYYHNNKYRYPRRNNQNYNYKNLNNSEIIQAKKEKETIPKTSVRNETVGDTTVGNKMLGNETFEKTTRTFENNSPLFEILGIKLYFDDILLICILFFLYQEGIQDEYLFIALILLLLS